MAPIDARKAQQVGIGSSTISGTEPLFKTAHCTRHIDVKRTNRCSVSHYTSEKQMFIRYSLKDEDLVPKRDFGGVNGLTMLMLM
jgi:hypothetical protein